MSSLEIKESGKEKKDGGMKRSLSIIFRYADWLDSLLMCLGTFGAIGDGMSTNCLLIFVSQLFNSLGHGKSPIYHGDFMKQIEKVLSLLPFCLF